MVRAPQFQAAESEWAYRRGLCVSKSREMMRPHDSLARLDRLPTTRRKMRSTRTDVRCSLISHQNLYGGAVLRPSSKIICAPPRPTGNARKAYTVTLLEEGPFTQGMSRAGF